MMNGSLAWNVKYWFNCAARGGGQSGGGFREEVKKVVQGININPTEPFSETISSD